MGIRARLRRQDSGEEILSDAHNLVNQINKELLISLEIDFGIEVFTLSSISPKNNLNLNMFFSTENENNDKNENSNKSWLLRYGNPKTNLVLDDLNSNKLIKIKNEMIIRESVVDADKQKISIKIQKACETLRFCFSTRNTIEAEHVRTYNLITFFVFFLFACNFSFLTVTILFRSF